MSSRFADYEKTPLGVKLKSLVEGKDVQEGKRRSIEFEAFSREGFPAVTALVSEVAKTFQEHNVVETKERNFAKQSVGDFVARVMREAGYEKVGQRSVPGKVFTVGALWQPMTKRP